MSSERTITIVHPRVPGPWSPSPRDRQVAQRVADLAALGHRVRLVAVEAMGGGAPSTLASWGVEVISDPDHRRSALSDLDVLWLTDLAVPRWIRDRARDHDGALVIDLDRLPSQATRAGSGQVALAERPGLARRADAEADIELEVLARADLVLAAWPRIAEHLAGCGVSDVRYLPPTIPGRRIALDRPGEGLVHIGRWSNDPLGIDEAALATFLTSVSVLGFTPADVATLSEDGEPLLRATTQRRTTQIPRSESATRLLAARVAICTRFGGPGTPGRLAELAAIGLPFITTPSALEGCALEDMPSDLAPREHIEHVTLAKRLLHEDDLWWERSAMLRRSARDHLPARTRPLLADHLRHVGLDSSGPATATVTHLDDPPESTPTIRSGTLAGADERVRALEDISVPRRLFDREESIFTQSFVDNDRRYRQLHAAHFAPSRAALAPPTGGPDVAFSLLLPTWNTPVDTLGEALESVVRQSFRNWELCIVDDGSTDARTLRFLRAFAESSDGRINLRLNTENQGISGASNDALSMATKEWVVLLDHDDLLDPDALAWVANYISACPDYDLWYSDEDKVDPSGQRVSAFLKPDWSPDLELAVNYVCHLLVARRNLVEEVGGFRSRFDGAQDWDLVLRLTERTDRVGHIARPLYSWRMIEGSTAIDTGAKPKAHHAGHDALAEALQRRGIPGWVEDGNFATTHRVRYPVDSDPTISVLIPTRDRVDLLRSCIESLGENADGFDLDIVVIDNDSSDPETLAYLDSLSGKPGHQVVRYPHQFAFARQVNVGAEAATGELLLLLNNDATFSRPGSLRSMVELALRPEVGLVGAKLMFPPHARDGRPQHEGIVMGMAGLAYNVDLGGYMGLDNHIRNCSAVTAACAMLRTSVFYEVGGMEERLRVAYNDVDFALRIGELGYRVLYTPFAELQHPESASRGSLHPMDDEAYFISRWGSKGDVRDPFVSPHFEWMMPLFFKL